MVEKLLKEQLNVAINSGDFLSAGKINSVICEIEQNNDEEIIQNFINKFQAQLNEYSQLRDDQVASINKVYEQQEIVIRQKISDSFHKLQINHIDVLIEHEKQCLFNFANIQLLPDSSAEKIREQAKIAGYRKDFDLAENLKSKAEHIENEERQRKENKLKDDFLDKRRTMLNKQKSEIIELSKQLKFALHVLNVEKQKQITKVNQKYRFGIREALQQTKQSIKENVKNGNLMNKCIQNALIYIMILCSAVNRL